MKNLINEYKILNDAKYFSSGIFQNYLVFIPSKKYIKYFNGTTQIYSRKYNEISEETIEIITKSNSLFVPIFVNHYILPDVSFNGYCLINKNISVLKNVTSLYISYKINPWLRDLNKFRMLIQRRANVVATASDLILVQNFHWQMEMWEKMSSFLELYSSFMHIDNKNKDILVLVEGPSQGLDDTTLLAEAKFPIIFTQSGKRFV